MMSGFSTSIKCCIIGSVSVGKTSIVQQYLSKNSSTETTLGAIYWLLNHKTESGNNLKIDFSVLLHNHSTALVFKCLLHFTEPTTHGVLILVNSIELPLSKTNDTLL